MMKLFFFPTLNYWLSCSPSFFLFLFFLYKIAFLMRLRASLLTLYTLSLFFDALRLHSQRDHTASHEVASILCLGMSSKHV